MRRSLNLFSLMPSPLAQLVAASQSSRTGPQNDLYRSNSSDFIVNSIVMTDIMTLSLTVARIIVRFSFTQKARLEGEMAASAGKTTEGKKKAKGTKASSSADAKPRRMRRSTPPQLEPNTVIASTNTAKTEWRHCQACERETQFTWAKGSWYCDTCGRDRHAAALSAKSSPSRGGHQERDAGQPSGSDDLIWLGVQVTLLVVFNGFALLFLLLFYGRDGTVAILKDILSRLFMSVLRLALIGILAIGALVLLASIYSHR